MLIDCWRHVQMCREAEHERLTKECEGSVQLVLHLSVQPCHPLRCGRWNGSSLCTEKANAIRLHMLCSSHVRVCMCVCVPMLRVVCCSNCSPAQTTKDRTQRCHVLGMIQIPKSPSGGGVGHPFAVQKFQASAGMHAWASPLVCIAHSTPNFVASCDSPGVKRLVCKSRSITIHPPSRNMRKTTCTLSLKWRRGCTTP